MADQRRIRVHPDSRSFCIARFERMPSPKQDPCGGCPLFTPCITKAPTGLLSMKRMDLWAHGVNEAWERLACNHAIVFPS